MPYKLEREGAGWVVTGPDGKKYSKKPLSKRRATRQLRALYMNSPEAKEVSSTPTGIPSGGPGGMAGTMGLGPGGKKWGRRKKKEVTEKHLQGKHNQKTHGFRFGAGGGMPLDTALHASYLRSRNKREGVETNPKKARAKYEALVKKDPEAAHVFLKKNPGVVMTDADKTTFTRSINKVMTGEYTHGRIRAEYKKILEKYNATKGNPESAEFKLAAKRRMMYETLGERVGAGSDWSQPYAIRKEFSPIASEKSGIMVYKDKQQHFRWILFSSNSFQDRDRQIVSTKALNEDVDRSDLLGMNGIDPLLWWHLPGYELGRCDLRTMHGKILIESGTFKSETVGEKIKEAADRGELGVSIGFFHPRSEPDAEGVFHNIRIFERSILPKRRASNPFTQVMVSGG